MRTAVSIPDEVYHGAERLARHAPHPGSGNLSSREVVAQFDVVAASLPRHQAA
ncbi:MAG: hypothetical protein ABSF71_38785 [Terriglobia bacterium]